MQNKTTRSDAPTDTRLEPIRLEDQELPSESSGVSDRPRAQPFSEPPTQRVMQSLPDEEAETVRVEPILTVGARPSLARPSVAREQQHAQSLRRVDAPLYSETSRVPKRRSRWSLAFASLGVVTTVGTLGLLLLRTPGENAPERRVVSAPVAQTQLAPVVEAARAEPMPAEPMPAEPAVAVPVMAEPVAAEPAVADPVLVVEPALAAAAVVAPVAVEPVAADPGAADPGAAEAVAVDTTLELATQLKQIEMMLRGNRARPTAEQARTLLEPMIAEHADNPHLHAALATACMRLRDTTCALTAAQRAVRLRPRREEYRALEAEVRSTLSLPVEPSPEAATTEEVSAP